jgi:hypothetical protein
MQDLTPVLQDLTPWPYDLMSLQGAARAAAAQAALVETGIAEYVAAGG